MPPPPPHHHIVLPARSSHFTLDRCLATQRHLRCCVTPPAPPPRSVVTVGGPSHTHKGRATGRTKGFSLEIRGTLDGLNPPSHLGMIPPDVDLGEAEGWRVTPVLVGKYVMARHVTGQAMLHEHGLISTNRYCGDKDY
jgi:hypothetical protein